MKYLKPINENLKPGYTKNDLLNLLKPIMNQIYEVTFTEEAKRTGINDKDEQVMAQIISHLFEWDYESLTKIYAYALEDSNYSDDATEIGNKIGLDI